MKPVAPSVVESGGAVKQRLETTATIVAAALNCYFVGVIVIVAAVEEHSQAPATPGSMFMLKIFLSIFSSKI